MTVPNNLDALLTTTLNNYRKTLIDNVFTDRPLLDFLSRKDKIKTIAGGANIQVPLLYGKSTAVTSFHNYDTLDITAQDGISAAIYDWRSVAVSIAISGEEEAKNSGEAAIIDLLGSKVMQAEESLSDALASQLFGDGTAHSGKDFDGLAKLVDSSKTVGGIAPGTYTWWVPTQLDANADADPERSDAEWTRVYNTASKGNNHPDFAITTQALFEHYEAGLAPQLRFTSNDQADARFQNLMFKGIPLYFDFYCPTGQTFFLNSKYLELTGHKDRWFKNTGFKTAPDKDARWAQIISMGNLTCSNRSRQARVFGQTVVPTP